MLCALKHFEDGTRDFVRALDGLVGIGDGAQRYYLGLVALGRQFALQHLGGVGLGIQLGLEIEAGGMAEIAVRGTRITIDATVLAPAIGIDRLLERNIRAIIARDDALGRLDHHLRLQRLKIARLIPPIVERLPQFRLKPPDPVRPRTTAVPNRWT